MGEVVNLRSRRKAKARADRSAKAAENRMRFCRSSSERQRLRTEEFKRARELDGRRLESGDDT